ncbi:MAG: hypothetical protein K2O88_09820 [Paramuribaculum sp.]|nr:hypothetical protein [Paramuribaculum sp.]
MKLFRFVAFMAVAAVMAVATSCSGVKDKGLNAAVEEINKQLANETMPGIEKMSLSVDDNYVIYHYIVDEDYADIKQMESVADQQKQTIMQSVIAEPSNQSFVKLVKLTDRGMKFEYKGNKTNEGYEIVVENNEL